MFNFDDVDDYGFWMSVYFMGWSETAQYSGQYKGENNLECISPCSVGIAYGCEGCPAPHVQRIFHQLTTA